MRRQRSTRNRKEYCRRATMLFRCLSAIFLLLVGAFIFDAVGRNLVRYVVERVYTPPAITPENATLYNRFVALIKAHPEHEGKLC